MNCFCGHTFRCDCSHSKFVLFCCFVVPIDAYLCLQCTHVLQNIKESKICVMYMICVWAKDCHDVPRISCELLKMKLLHKNVLDWSETPIIFWKVCYACVACFDALVLISSAQSAQHCTLAQCLLPC